MGVPTFSKNALGATPATPLPPVTTKRKRATTPRSRLLFVKGPIPVAWLTTVCALCKPAHRVGLALWFQRGITGRDTVRLNNQLKQRWGISGSCAHRGVQALAAAKLIEIVQGGRGRCPVVRIVHRPAGQ